MAKDTKKLGSLGEKATANYLKRMGFSIIQMNYLKRWGEIDLIARKEKLVHFIEVKTVSREITGVPGNKVSHETYYRAEENVHRAKLQRLHRAIETWLLENDYEGEWQIDVAAVAIDRDRRRGKVRFIENVVLE